MWNGYADGMMRLIQLVDEGKGFNQSKVEKLQCQLNIMDMLYMG